MKKILICLSLATALCGGSARAELTLLPDTHHQLYQTYGLYFEPQNTVVWRTPRHAWGAVGGAMALAQATVAEHEIQFLVTGTANAAFRFNDRYNTVLTETIDARVGLLFQMPLSDTDRVYVGWTHYSGHTSDDIPNPELKNPNLGDEYIDFRYVHDFADRLRVGGTLKPIVGSEPGMKVFAADQFADWQPWGSAASWQRPTPYIAMGLEEQGVERVVLTSHVQLGLLFGHHMQKEHHTSLRTVVGYYRGLDPRLKYMQFRLGRSEFGYVGVMADF